MERSQVTRNKIVAGSRMRTTTAKVIGDKINTKSNPRGFKLDKGV